VRLIAAGQFGAGRDREDRSRPDVVWTTAVRALDAQHRTTSLIRLGFVAVMWAIAASLPARGIARAGPQLSLATAGCLLSYAHARPALVEAFERLPGLASVAGHLTATRGRATFDVPGLFEAFGAVSAGLLFAGPWPVAGLSTPIRSVAVIAAVGFAWLVGLNTTIDAGWYAPTMPVVMGTERSVGPPPKVLVVFRHLQALLLAILVALIVGIPWTPAVAAIPWVLRVSAICVMLLLQVVWTCFEQILTAAVETVRDAEDVVRKGAAQDLHSLTKNAVRLVATAVEAEAPNPSEVRALVRDLLVVVEETRLAMLAEGAAARAADVADLWHAVTRILADGARSRCVLAAGADLVLGGTDYQLARRVLADLVVNALKAGAEHVEVTIAVVGEGPSSGVELDVADDGPGMPSDALDDPRGSLRLLDWELRRYGGGITFTTERKTGTVVRARWSSPRRVRTETPPGRTLETR
jgi:hypothetical protein